MRVDNVAFTQANASDARLPRFTIAMSFDTDNSDLVYLTSHADGAYPTGATVIANCIQSLSGVSQHVKPDTGNSTIGNFSFSVVDAGLTDTIRIKLNEKKGLRHKRVQVWVGFEGFDWLTEYELRHTFIIDSISFNKGVYRFSCSDINRIVRKDIFIPHKTTLQASITADANRIPCYASSVTSFPAFAHDNSYTDAPGLTVGYAKIGDEIFRHAGLVDNGGVLEFVVSLRGALNTVAKAHDIKVGAATDRQPKIDEYIYLEGPAVKIAVQLLTGSVLPDHWNLGVPAEFVRNSDFENIGVDWWNTADDTGRVVRFEGLKKTDGKRFIEKELMQWLGAFMPIYSDGALGLKRLVPILSNSGYSAILNKDNASKYSQLTHDLKSVINKIKVDWNWDDNKERFTKTTYLIDGESFDMHSDTPIKELKFRGVHTNANTDNDLRDHFAALRGRYVGPPQLLSLNCLPELNVLEVGDPVKVQLDQIQDFAGTATLDRVFEVQQVSTNWVSGELKVKLFGSSQAPGVIDPGSTANRLDDVAYETGTELSTVLTISGNAITANGHLPAGTYHYLGNLTLNAGVTVTFDDHVNLYVRGFLTINGTFDGKGRGLLGQLGQTSLAAPNKGLTGYVGSTQSSSGFTYVDPGGVIIFIHDNLHIGSSPGLNPTLPIFALKNKGSSLEGVPANMQGTSGGGSGAVIKATLNNTSVLATGSDGGNGGASITIINRGMSFGASGKIITSGEDGVAYNSLATTRGNTVYSGSGAGGAPGGVLILLDGAYAVPDYLSHTVADLGACDIPSVPGIGGSSEVSVNNKHRRSKYVGYQKQSMVEAVARVQYIPEQESVEPEIPSTHKIPALTNFDLTSGQDEHLLIGSDGTIIQRVKASWTATTDPSARGYQVAIKKSIDAVWRTYLFTDDTSQTEEFFILQDGEQWDFRVRVLAEPGADASDYATVLGYTALKNTQPPPDLDSFLINVLPDGTREFIATLDSPPIDMSNGGIKIRYQAGTGGVWETMAELHTGLIKTFPWETNQLAAGAYTFAAKAVDQFGNPSVNALYIQQTLADPPIGDTVVSVDVRATRFLGIKTNCWFNNGALRPNNTTTWTDYLTWSAFSTWNDSPVTSMSYEHTVIDIGSNISFIPLVSAYIASGTITHEVSVSDDNITFTPFAPISGAVTGRFVKIKTTVANPAITGITQYSILFSAEVVKEVISDIDTSTVSSPAGDFRAPLNKTFSIIRTARVSALQNVGAGWTWELIDKDKTLGPRFKIYNASQVLADAVVDIEIEGIE